MRERASGCVHAPVTHVVIYETFRTKDLNRTDGVLRGESDARRDVFNPSCRPYGRCLWIAEEDFSKRITLASKDESESVADLAHCSLAHRRLEAISKADVADWNFVLLREFLTKSVSLLSCSSAGEFRGIVHGSGSWLVVLVKRRLLRCRETMRGELS